MPLTQIRRAVIDEQFSGVTPIGGIIMYKGAIADLPSGWSFCDGTNGTPDLRNKFIIGASADSGGQANTTVTGSTTKTGGTANAIVVSHTHTATVTDPGHTHVLSPAIQSASGTDGNPNKVSGGTGSTNITANGATTGITVTNSTEGSSGTNQNLPPYYALAFIMRIS
jgi:hypothetical protein